MAAIALAGMKFHCPDGDVIVDLDQSKSIAKKIKAEQRAKHPASGVRHCGEMSQ
jgi:hypothetical protein